MKKLFCLLLTLCLVLPLIACTKEDPQVTTTTTPTTTQSHKLKDLPLRVGVIYTGKATEADTGSYAIHEELKKAMVKCGLDEELDVFVEELVPELTSDVLKAVDRLVEDGALIIFGTALGYNEALAQAAEKYPDVVFCQMGGLNGNGYNFVTYFAPLYQAYYMMGAAAAMKAKELECEDIGFISSSGKETPEAAAIINAFARGVQVYLPNATVYLRILEPGATEALEMEAVDDLYQLHGCKVFGQFTHTAGTLKQATDLGLYATGPWFELRAEKNQKYRNSPLASPQVRWYSFFTQAIQAVQNCDWADEFAMAMGTTNFYGTYHAVATKPSNSHSLFYDLGSIGNIEAIYSISALSPQQAYQVLPVYPGEADGPDATVGTTLVPNPVQGPFAGFLYNVQIDMEHHKPIITAYEAAMADVDGNIRIPAGELGLDAEQIREMDYYVMGITLA